MKTPALDFLSKNKAVFKTYEYQSSDTHDFGDKTYVTCIVPVSGRISLKAAARAAKLKHLETVDPATATRVTGYVVGGISPFGQKRRMAVLIDQSVLSQDEILVSAGQRGMSVGMKPQDLIDLLQATVADVLEK